MAAGAAVLAAFLPTPLLRRRRPFFSIKLSPHIPTPICFLPSLHAPPPRSSIRGRVFAVATLTTSEVIATEDSTSESNFLACPVCYGPLSRKGPSGLNLPAIYRSGFRCDKCNKPFTSKDIYLDLTVTSGTKEYKESKPSRTELFRSPLVSFLYERGWRQSFDRSGFPGPDEEFKIAQDFFKPVAGGILVDVSCGSGLFSRRFVNSDTYSAVIALDFSESMLRQCYNFIKNDENILKRNLVLVRADVARLPFRSKSIDAVHAGAALHCWPSPSNAVAEISRILRSGGIFVASTFLSTRSNRHISSLEFFNLTTNSYAYFRPEEIEDLIKSCGLINYTSEIRRSFIMFSAQKP